MYFSVSLLRLTKQGEQKDTQLVECPVKEGEGRGGGVNLCLRTKTTGC